MNKFFKFIICFLALVLGFGVGGVYITYVSLPETDELHISEEVYYSYNDSAEISNIELSGENGELSVHFLELGNKYTGDCTYIRYGDVDILIDCGSKSNSISYVSEYLKSYMKDDIIEYCIVTHAHTDHYAGFATSGKTKSMFELFKYETIIDFGSATNKDSSSGVLKKYETKRDEAIERDGADYFDVSNDAKLNNNKVYEIGDDGEVKLEILYNYYYDHSISGTENNYSVCVLLSYEEKNFLFTGDLEEHGSKAETKLIENNASLQAIRDNGKDYGVDLYKAGHHGSSTSSSEDFISAIRPKVVCVCCCAGSEEYTKAIDNQFPTQAFINVVARYTKEIYVTSLCVNWENDEFTSMNGNIVVIVKPYASNSFDFGVKCSNNQTYLKDSEWFNRTITIDGGSRPMRIWPEYGKK